MFQELSDVLNQDFSTIAKQENKKQFNLKLFEDYDYISFKFFELVSGVVDSYVFNISAVAEAWVFGAGNQSRVQYVEYSFGNDTGVPYEIITTSNTNGYLIDRGTGGIQCSTISFTPYSDLDFLYIESRFITPSYEDFGILWGPRLIDLYILQYNAHVLLAAGVDAFNGDLVLFYDHETKVGYDIEEFLIVHEIGYDEFDLDNVELPNRGITCPANTEKKDFIPKSFPYVFF